LTKYNLQQTVQLIFHTSKATPKPSQNLSPSSQMPVWKRRKTDFQPGSTSTCRQFGMWPTENGVPGGVDFEVSKASSLRRLRRRGRWARLVMWGTAWWNSVSRTERTTSTRRGSYQAKGNTGFEGQDHFQDHWHLHRHENYDYVGVAHHCFLNFVAMLWLGQPVGLDNGRYSCRKCRPRTTSVRHGEWFYHWKSVWPCLLDLSLGVSPNVSA